MSFELCPECRAEIGDPDKVALLEHYAARSINLFDQCDGILHGADSVSDAGDDDALFGTLTWDVHGAADVRIQIRAGTSKQDALRLLRKMVKWIATSYSPVTMDDAPRRPAQQAALAKCFSVPDGIPF